jgi:hypothetical protein
VRPSRKLFEWLRLVNNPEETAKKYHEADKVTKDARRLVVTARERRQRLQLELESYRRKR